MAYTIRHSEACICKGGRIKLDRFSIIHIVAKQDTVF